MVKARIVIYSDEDLIDFIVDKEKLKPSKIWRKNDKRGSSILRYDHYGCSFDIECDSKKLSEILQKLIDLYGEDVLKIIGSESNSKLERELSMIIYRNPREIDMNISQEIISFCFRCGMSIDMDIM